MSHVLDARPEPRRRRQRNPFAVVVALVLFIALIAGAGVFIAQNLPSFGGGPADYAGDGTGQVIVTVAEGDSAGMIATELQAKDVVKSREAFVTAAAANERSRSIQPGAYNLRSQMSAAAALDLLLDPGSKAFTRVTIPEGTFLEDTLTKIADQTNLTKEALDAAAADPSTLGVPAYADGQLEGFLFPATYEVQPGTTATEMLSMMVARYQQAAQDVGLEAGAKALGRTPYEVLITASLIEKETAFPADRSKVARVVYNRLADGMKLQFDSTVNYAKKEDTSLQVSTKDLEIDSPYNTYKYAGLPPTPIGSPGQAALQAAVNPVDGNLIYFVLQSTDGSSFFTDNYQDFLNAKNKAQAEGIF